MVLEKYNPIKPTNHVLDLGCGPGKITAELSEMIPRGKILGIDSSASMINHAKQVYSAIKNLCTGLKNVLKRSLINYFLKSPIPSFKISRYFL